MTGNATGFAGATAMMGLLAHDLRTPISCICGAAQTALDGAAQGAQTEEYLRQILGAAKVLEAMTGELLDGGAPREAAFDGEALEAELCALVCARAKERGQRLTIEMGALAGRRFVGDQASLYRVLTNLLSNAVKYTPRGGHIALEASLCGEGDALTARFRVSDDGVGMTDEFVKRLYEPFARAQETQDIEGYGLGLASVRRLVERMRGTIDVQSRWGEGTTFTVCVPLREASPTDGTDRAILRGQRLLLAEDNALGGRIMTALLAAQGAKAEWTPDGAQAVRRFDEAGPGRYTAVLLDLRMPEMDGPGAARAIRAMPREDARRVPIFALTAGGGREDERAALSSGMDACLLKPLDLNALCAALARFS